MRSEKLTLTGLLGDFRLLVILFIFFRFILLIAYQPLLVDGSERGIGTGGDRLYHYALAELTKEGQWPFRDWWSEFPPVWYWTTTAVYQLLGQNASYDNWSLVLGALMIGVEVGNLTLMRAIGAKLHGPNSGMALAWVYALMVAPVIFMWWNFDALVAFFLLLGLWWLLAKQDMRSAVAVALGALTKFVPAVLLGAVFRFRDARAALRYAAVAFGVFALVYLPLMAQNAEMTAVSLTAQFGKPSYQTVWAIIDGNYTTGNFGSLMSHFDPDGVNEVQGNPARIPSFIRLGAALALGLLVYARTRRFDDIGLTAFVGITLLLFYLQSQGWSPQWLAQIIPLILLVFPTRNGVFIAILLTLLAITEYPFLFIRTGDTGGVISGALFGPWVIIVLLRTLVLVMVCLMFYQKLRQAPVAGDE